MVGNRFGKLLVIRLVSNNPVRWECRCDCGNTTLVATTKLTAGHTRSCGCLVSEVNSNLHRIDLTGLRFGSLTVLHMAGMRQKKNGRNFQTWLCECDCGKTLVATTDVLQQGGRTTCREISTGLTCGENVSVGRRFGRLIVVARSEHRARDNERQWDCLCDCGRTAHVRGYCLSSGMTQSCGCQIRTYVDGIGFRSRWELFWYLSARERGLSVEYEQTRISVMVNGKKRVYVPDFRIVGTDRYIEIKGRKYELGMKKHAAAIALGYDVQLIDADALRQWCGCLPLKMQRHFAVGGVDAVRKLIVDALRCTGELVA